MFVWLMLFQWLACIGLAVAFSPLTWAGATSAIHPHVWAALVLGGAITCVPVLLALYRPGQASTRQAVAVGQMLMSALLIHVMNGRIEAHFQIFGSLAFLAFYRDWRVPLGDRHGRRRGPIIFCAASISRPNRSLAPPP